MRAVIADDSLLVRTGIAHALTQRGIEVAGEAADAGGLLRKIAALHPDVAVVDIRMPPTQTDEGLRAAEAIADRYPDCGVLVLSQYVDASYAIRLLELRSHRMGYLLKDRIAHLDAFADAVRRVAAGGSAIDPEVVGHAMGRRRAADPLAALSEREREILGLMAQGLSNSAIAAAAFLSLKTVESHVTSILGKLEIPRSEDANRRVLAVLKYLRD